MKPTTTALRVLATWAYLVAVYVVLGIILSSDAPPPANAGPWFLLSTLLTALVLCLLTLRSDWRGARLAVAVSGIHAIITLTNYLEGIVFLTDVAIDWPTEVLRTCAISALLLPLWPLLVRSTGKPESHFRPLADRSMSERLRRFVLADLAYPVLYFVAGMIVFPFIRDFYTTQTLPPAGQLFALQLLVRGPIYVGVCILMTRMFGLSRMAGAVAVGAALVTLNGIAPLIIPSGVFPDHVRWAHLIEIASSNLVFGFFVAWLWGPASGFPRRLPASGAEVLQ
jgi:hypothetical protein